MSAAVEALRRTLIGAFLGALVDLDPALLVARALQDAPAPSGRVRIVAAGKAAPRMAEGALATWGAHVDRALVISVDGAQVAPTLTAHPSVTVLRAAHPLPDERSARAAIEALACARGLSAEGMLLALISGGTSALLSLPPDGLSLADKQRVVATLLEGGAPIAEVNLVRRHLSRIKGGRLALAAAPAAVRTLLICDVVGGEPHDVGSGPTVPDPTTSADARAILARRAPALCAEGLDRLLEDTPAPERFPVRAEARMLAEPEDLARAVAARLAGMGFSVQVAPAEGGDAATVAARRIQQAHALPPGSALIVPCEPTVALPAMRGHGGRAGWVALRALRDLPPDVAFLCGASDGTDGNAGTAGAAVTHASASSVDPAWLEEALASFDDARVHRALRTAIEIGPTGHNLTDVHVLARTTG